MKKFIFFFLAIILLFSCKSFKMKAETTPNKFCNYQKYYKNWLREVKLFKGGVSKIYISGIFRDEEFTRCQIEEIADKMSFTEPEKNIHMDSELCSLKDKLEFIVAVYTPDPLWNNLDQEKSVWNIFLEIDSKTTLKPVSIMKIKKNDASLDFLYEGFSDIGYSIYKIIFSKDELKFTLQRTNKVELIFSGFPGKASLIW